VNTKQIAAAYQLARERYAALGVNTDKVLKELAGVPVSLHCWQGDDVGGSRTSAARAHGRHRGHGELSRQGPHAG
jgi:L-rhamnose isomerase